PFVFELRDLWPASIVAVGAMRRGFAIRLLEKIELFLYRRARAIVAVTHAFKDDLVARGIDAEKIAVVVNGVDLERYAPAARDAALAAEFGIGARFAVGYIGTHGMAHALDKVLAAAERLRGRDDLVFFFAGGGAERAHVEAIVHERELANVRLVPRQPKETMPRLWSLCDLAIIPLRDSPVFATVIPSKLFECMGMGVPVLMALRRGDGNRRDHGLRCRRAAGRSGRDGGGDRGARGRSAALAGAADGERHRGAAVFARRTGAAHARSAGTRRAARIGGGR